MSKIKAVIFDLDGTLLDTIEDIKDSLNYVITQFGYNPITSSQCKLMVGDSFVKLIQRAIAPATPSPEVEHQIFEKLNEHYRANPKLKTKPYDGIDKVMELLDTNSIPYAVATNKDQESAVSVVQKYMPYAKPLYIKGVDPVTKIRKPDPLFVEDMFLHLEKSVSSIKKDEVLFIGDSDVDYLTAKNGKVRFAWVTWGFRDMQSMKNAGLTDSNLQEISSGIVANNTSELINILKSLI